MVTESRLNQGTILYCIEWAKEWEIKFSYIHIYDVAIMHFYSSTRSICFRNNGEGILNRNPRSVRLCGYIFVPNDVGNELVLTIQSDSNIVLSPHIELRKRLIKKKIDKKKNCRDFLHKRVSRVITGRYCTYLCSIILYIQVDNII